MANFVKFSRKSKTGFNNLTNKDTNTIYFVNGEGNTNNQLYLGSHLYGVDVINDDSIIPSSTTVYSTSAAKAMVMGKADSCTLRTYTDTTLPTVVSLSNNTEYRYTMLSGATGLNITINSSEVPNNQTNWMFYSSIVLHSINTNVPINEFVTMDSGSAISNIVFLNIDAVDMTDKDVLELLFFANGMSNQICCIGYAYADPTVTP